MFSQMYFLHVFIFVHTLLILSALVSACTAGEIQTNEAPNSCQIDEKTDFLIVLSS